MIPCLINTFEDMTKNATYFLFIIISQHSFTYIWINIDLKVAFDMTGNILIFDRSKYIAASWTRIKQIWKNEAKLKK